ncbi:MAG: aldo/keto reductase [Thermoplasmata archaeon]
MEQVELGKSGIRVSRIGVGMWQAGVKNPWGDDVSDEDSIAAMVRAHELGVNLFDTAEGYGAGHSEEVVGRAIRAIGRDEVVIATKVSGNHLRYDDVQRACDRSLTRLGVDAIDVYQVHWPDPRPRVESLGQGPANGEVRQGSQARGPAADGSRPLPRHEPRLGR